ncbi:glycosyltransferase family 4 protein [Methylophilus glucosoxydans]|uniref:Glycosyltransferase family 4 protein n=1 Tax=Methylophilus glucosoxydans TaxID=752553 RepID=A0ABW3GL30_9PROT
MRVLFCSEFYYPSVGGVQEVMRQVAERLVELGHDVTVATSKLANRATLQLNGVSIKEFDVKGNFVSGMLGEVLDYQTYLITSEFDVIMIKAAQQWTFDATWEIIDRIKTPKVFIPCGFSALYNPEYEAYFKLMPAILKQFDHLIFYASKYRDIEFAKKNGITNYSILPNGASEKEFNCLKDLRFRERNKISENSFLYLTVGSFTGTKGHWEVVKAFESLDLQPNEHATLILNGNIPYTSTHDIWRNLKLVFNSNGLFIGIKHLVYILFKKLGVTFKKKSPEEIAKTINLKQSNKKVIISDFPRNELIQAFMNADLFVFASNIEYSPLVLFESAAAGTPFLTVDVGNSLEILEWTGGGFVCESYKNHRNFTNVEIQHLATSMRNLMNDKSALDQKGRQGKIKWQEKFTWDVITKKYEAILMSVCNRK